MAFWLYASLLMAQYFEDMLLRREDGQELDLSVLCLNYINLSWYIYKIKKKKKASIKMDDQDSNLSALMRTL